MSTSERKVPDLNKVSSRVQVLNQAVNMNSSALTEEETILYLSNTISNLTSALNAVVFRRFNALIKEQEAALYQGGK